MPGNAERKQLLAYVYRKGKKETRNKKNRKKIKNTKLGAEVSANA